MTEIKRVKLWKLLFYLLSYQSHTTLNSFYSLLTFQADFVATPNNNRATKRATSAHGLNQNGDGKKLKTKNIFFLIIFFSGLLCVDTFYLVAGFYFVSFSPVPRGFQEALFNLIRNKTIVPFVNSSRSHPNLASQLVLNSYLMYYYFAFSLRV